MANKELAKRQKLTIRVEPSQKALKARNPIAPDARQRVTQSQQPPLPAGKPLQQRLLKKMFGGGD
ncbi:MAG TPA: hypothetical protein VF427_08320 [Noviherbaspirillum sp.]